MQKQMSRLITILLICLLTGSILAQESTEEALGTSLPLEPLPVATLEQDGLKLEFFYQSVEQGDFGVIRLRGDNIQSAYASLLNSPYAFHYLAEDQAWYGLIPANMDLNARDYQLPIVVTLTDQTTHQFDTILSVSSGGFIRQDFTLNSDKVDLIDPEVERHEFARLDAIFTTHSDERYWQDGWVSPVNSELTSPFGNFRTLNEQVQTRHTGWDLKAQAGTPVMAMGSGVVAFARPLDIRGNYVIINHGWGVFSGYAHLSQVHVTQGQTVEKGQIIGMSGNSGRSSGPHLHWDVAVNGEWMDAVDLFSKWLP
ncbi:hypothetical protein MASR2M15_01140 [Anaerolineales bacterium]